MSQIPSLFLTQPMADFTVIENEGIENMGMLTRNMVAANGAIK